MTQTSSPQLLDTLVKLCSQNLGECLERAVRSAKAQLYEKLHNLSDSEQGDFSYAVNLLDSNVDWIVNRISSSSIQQLQSVSQLENDFVQPAEQMRDEQSKDSPDATKTTVTNLSLVSKNEFEDWLLVDVSKKKLERELGAALQDICYIFSTIKALDINVSNLSIGPEMLLTRLKNSIDQLQIPTVAQITIYRAVTDSLSSDLLRIYSELKTRAASEGVIAPRTILRKQSGAASAEVKEDDVEIEDHSESASALNSESSDSNNRYSSLNTLARMGAVLQNGNQLGKSVETQQGVLGSPGNRVLGENRSGAAIESSTDSSPSALLAQLKKSTSKQLDLTADSQTDTLRDWVRRELSASNRSEQDLTASEKDLINVTDSLFEAISLEISGNQTLERWLKKLKVVILKSVLSDQGFFTNIDHPARAMLNKLGSLAEIVESGHAHLASILDRSIDKVVVEYDADVNSIDSVVSELSSIFERHVAAYKRNSERLARSYEGKQRVASVRHHIVSDLTRILSVQPVPDVVLTLLDKCGWREYLALTAIRDGCESFAYVEGLEVINLLIEWLSALYGDDAEAASVASVELGMESASLLDMLERELAGAGKAGFEPTLQELEKCLLHNTKPSFVEVQSYTWPFGEGESELNDLLPKELDRSRFSRWHRQVMGMQAGDWIQLLGDGHDRVLRLAWAGSDSFRFVFVDTQGMKDEDMSIDELADRLKAGRAKLIEHSEVPLVDQGLHRMVQSTYEELSGQANCDALTGLLTRQALERALDQTSALSMSTDSRSSFIYVDISQFNVTNNTHGHAAGDAVLRNLAAVLRDFSGETSFCGRLGGNEFGVVLKRCSAQQAKRVAESISGEVASNGPQFKGTMLKTNLNFGIHEIDYEVDDYDSVLLKSELACREAKDSNSAIVVYEPQSEDLKRRSDHLHWVNKLEGSLDSLLTLRVQEIRPISNVESSKSHWEILLGLRHEGQVIPPAPLIDAAEHFGKMTIVDYWVVKSSLAWMADNQEFVESSSGFSINLSGNSLSDHEFLDSVESLVLESGIPARKICFEITETSAIVNLSCATEFIRVLKKLGCLFSLDDFGSGLSSYAYIQQLPVDYIKIDGMFIRNLVHSENDQALVHSINELAHFMGMETVAEFVENHEILEVLKAIGVDHSQGYGIRKPMLLQDLSA